MSTTIDEDFYTTYGLDPNDPSVEKIVLPFYEALGKVVDKGTPIKDAFYECVLAWDGFKVLPDDTRTKYKQLASNFRDIWKYITKSMLDEFHWLYFNEKKGEPISDEFFESMIELIMAIDATDKEIWNIDKTFVHILDLLGSSRCSSETSKAVLFILCGKMRGMLRHPIDLKIKFKEKERACGGLNKAQRESLMLLTAGIYHHFEAKRGAEMFDNTESYALIIATTISELIDASATGDELSDARILLKEAYDVLSDFDSAEVRRVRQKLESHYVALKQYGIA